MKDFKSAILKLIRSIYKKIVLLFHGYPTYDIVSKVKWENQYEEGRWKRLDNIDELARYNIITGYYDYYLSEGFLDNRNLLDVGCGHGILQKKLNRIGYSSYTGLDISEKAIIKASENSDKSTSFFQQDLESYNTTKKFDFIIFNEVLVYVKSPSSIIRRYTNYLSKNGIIIISEYCDKTMDKEHSWNVIDEAFSPNDAIKLIHESGKSWIVKSYVNVGQT